jgi:dnd system-associated protein 4
VARRVRRPADKAELLTKLTEDKESQVFSSQIDAMMFAAALGAHRSQSAKFEKSLEPMVFELFSRRSDYEALFHLLAIEKSGGIDLLGDAKAEDRLTTFEEFANAGLQEIAQKVRGGERSPLDAVIDLVLSAEVPQAVAGKPDLRSMAKDLGL